MQIASAARRGAPMSRDTVARASEMAARSIANALLPKANPFFARYSSRSPPFPRDCAGAGGRSRNIMPSARKSSRGKMKRNASHTCHAGMEEDEIAGETAANTEKKEGMSADTAMNIIERSDSLEDIRRMAESCEEDSSSAVRLRGSVEPPVS